jgi:hypothetical protein
VILQEAIVKARNFVLALFLLFSAGIPLKGQAADQLDCVQLSLSGLADLLIQNWDTSGEKCLEITNDLQKNVFFHVDSGWLFGQAQVHNGETVVDLLITPPTPPDTASSVNEQRWEIPTGGKLVFNIEPPLLPALPEIGLRFRVYPATPVCKQLEVREKSGLEQLSWPDREGACVEVSFPGFSGLTRLEFSGWVFGGPVTMSVDGNIEELELTPVPGEQALQVVPFEVNVSEVTLIKLQFADGTSGRELGLRWAPSKQAPFQVYMPYMGKPAERKQVTVSPGFRTYTASWGNPNNMEACADFRFQGGGDARIIRGWFFGDIVSSTLNGTPLTIPTYRTLEELATQVSEFRLTQPSVLTVCLNGSDLEVGFSINY